MTRRLYRDGTSEYEINGAPCRLLDFHELLSDGGRRPPPARARRPGPDRQHPQRPAGRAPRDHRRSRRCHQAPQPARSVAAPSRADGRRRGATRATSSIRSGAVSVRSSGRRMLLNGHDSVKADILALRLWIGGEELRRLRRPASARRPRRRRLDAPSLRLLQSWTELRDRSATSAPPPARSGRALERDTAAAARLETVVERFHRIGMVARERRSSRCRAVSRVPGSAGATSKAERTYLDGELEALDRSSSPRRRRWQSAERSRSRRSKTTSAHWPNRSNSPPRALSPTARRPPCARSWPPTGIVASPRSGAPT